MTMLVDGELRPDARESTDDDGEFHREPTEFRGSIGDDLPAVADRYHLYISRACPWAHGTVLVRKLLGLEDVISMDILDPYRDRAGWQFTPEKAGCTRDSVNGAEYLSEVYTKADADYTGRISVPVLWDREAETIVNNESIDIMTMLATEFRDFGTHDIDLYPRDVRDSIDRIVDDLYNRVNNGVYRAGFAGTQQAYEHAVTDVFEGLDEWNEVLASKRYLIGDRLTLADLRFFPTLVRFDPVYHTHFKCTKRRIVDFPALWNYTKELYQLPGVADTVNMNHITEHYYRTHESINPRGIVPIGPDLNFEAPHDRESLPGRPLLTPQ